ncbi:MAG: type II secretion system F family protein [Nocardioidaceae bacterium]|nr:type II secretion system F family protein [Nocardioidaceae bacterium]MCL2615060.1 type II secretion system F family protein [Nocardioidaceae bacterium]
MTRRRAAAVLAGFLGLVVLLLAGAPAQASSNATIAHAEADSGRLQVLVDVPPGARMDLGGVTASLDGTSLDATASSARAGTTVERTAILAIDTSDSMSQQGRFAAAKQAALTYLKAVPADVKVGIVTFDRLVSVALPPTTDRSRATSVVDGLTLSRGTHLYDGLLSAVSAAGDTGQRSILVLSDGADTGSSATMSSAAGSIHSANALVDAVSLGRQAGNMQALREIASAGHGSVIQSSGTALTTAFRHEADVLASQILVSAPLPAGFSGNQATVKVTLPSNQGSYVASALAPIQGGATATPTVALPPPGGPTAGWSIPGWTLYAGIAILAIGLVTVAVLLVPGKPAPMTIADRLSEYTSRTRPVTAPEHHKPATEPVLEQAKAAAAGVLERNQGLDRRLTQRLAAAGSELKPSEWLLVHLGVVVVALLLGALVGRGNIIIALLFAVVGFVLPIVYLRWKAGKRRKSFNDALPEVLQLLAGALSAGLSLPQAVDTIVREGPDPIADEFKRVLVETRIGLSVEDAFEGVADRFDSKDFRWVVMAIRIQRQVGGNLAELLTTVAGTMRERAYLRRQVNALAAEGKLSAWILSLLPPAVTGFVMLTQPGYLTPLFHTAFGLIILVAAVLWLCVGVFWMSRMVKVEI